MLSVGVGNGACRCGAVAERCLDNADALLRCGESVAQEVVELLALTRLRRVVLDVGEGCGVG